MLMARFVHIPSIWVFSRRLTLSNGSFCMLRRSISKSHERPQWAENAGGTGVTREEVAEMIGVAIFMGGGPSTVYGAEALQAYDQFADKAGVAAE